MHLVYKSVELLQQLNALGPHVLFLESEFKAREIGCGKSCSNPSNASCTLANTKNCILSCEVLL